MRVSAFFLSTLKEAPAEAELVSHKLMLRAGLIKKLGSGLYTWMPLGLRVLRKVEAIVREEMNRVGAIELFMPAVQPAELWQETGRWEKFGPQMLKIKDRHERDYCFGPTHEEVITDIVRREIRSYRQLPVHFYQIQTKFRDEIRPRFGVMRAREFIMKDGYSFHADYADLEARVPQHVRHLLAHLRAAGLRFRAWRRIPGRSAAPVRTSSTCWPTRVRTRSPFAPTRTTPPTSSWPRPCPPYAACSAAQSMRKVATPGAHTIEDVSAFLRCPPRRS